MSRWRTARDSGDSLVEEEQSELQSLIDDEVNAACCRAPLTVKEISWWIRSTLSWLPNSDPIYSVEIIVIRCEVGQTELLHCSYRQRIIGKQT